MTGVQTCALPIYYFRDIYTTSNPSGFDEILNGIHPAISEEDAGLIGRDFHANEVRLALD